MLFTHAITRTPGIDFYRGITSVDSGQPVYERMLAQHHQYIKTLESLDIKVTTLGPLPGYPDAYFVEDVAIMLPEVAVITRPGAPTRRGERESIEPQIRKFRPIVRINPPGTLDGGDVLFTGRHCFIGLSERTNITGAKQLGSILNEHDLAWSTIPVHTGLHLKSSINCIAENCLVISRDYADDETFKGYDLVVLEAHEEAAATRFGSTII